MVEETLKSLPRFLQANRPCSLPLQGEVTELTPEETENPLGGYGRTISQVLIGLKTTRGHKQLRLDPSIYEVVSIIIELGCVSLGNHFLHVN